MGRTRKTQANGRPPKTAIDERDAEIRELRLRLEEAEETLRAIRSGEVDAVVVSGGARDQVYTLKGADETYRVVLQTMSEGAVTLDSSGTILFCNRQFADMTGRPMERVIGSAFTGCLRASDHGRFRKFLEYAYVGRARGEFELRREDRSGLRVLLSLSPLPVGGDEHISAIVTDISERRRAEDALQKAHDQLERRVAERTAELVNANARLRAEEEKLISIALFPDENPNPVLRVGKQGDLMYSNVACRRVLAVDRWEARDPIADALRTAALQAQESGEGTEFELNTPEGRCFVATTAPFPERGYTNLYLRDITDWKQAQQALEISEARLSTGLEATQVGLWDWDLKENRAHYSTTWYTMLGYEPYELPAATETWYLLMHPDDAARSEETMRKAWAGDIDSYETEFRMKAKGGEWRWVLSRGRVIEREPDGTPLRMIGTHTDITERRQIEEALRRSERELRTAQRVAQIGSWMWDPEADMGTWSEELFRIYGRDPAAGASRALAEDVRRTYTPESYERLRAAIFHAVEDGTPWDLELEMVTPDGTHKWLNARGEVSRDVNGKIRRLHGTVQDITQRKQMEEALRGSEERLLTAQRVAQIGNWIWDPKTNWGYWSEELYRIYELDPAEGTPDHYSGEIRRAYSPDSLERLTSSVNRALEDGSSWNLELEITTRNAHHKWLNARGEVVRDARGNVETLHGTVQDITLRKEAEREIRESRADLNRAQAVAHIGSWRIGRSNEALTWSDETYRMLGVPRGTPMTYRQFLEIVHPDDREYVNSQWSAAQETGVFDVQYRVIVHGEVRWMHALCRTNEFGAAETASYFGTIQDITERKQAEELLADYVQGQEFLSASATRLLRPASFEDLWQHTADSVRALAGEAIVLVNEFDPVARQTVVRAFEGPESKRVKALALLGNPVGMRVDFDEATRRQMQAGLLSKVEGGLYELAFGQIPKPLCRQIEQAADLGAVYAMPFQLAEDFMGTVAILTDREEGLRNRPLVEAIVNQAALALQRRRSEDALRESEQRFREMADGLPFIVWVRDADGQQKFVNETYCRFFGVTQEQMVAEQWHMVIHQEDIGAYSREFADCVRDRRPFHAECRAMAAGGEWRWIESFALPRFSASGEFLGMVGTSPDITERKHAELALSRSRDRLELLARTVSRLLHTGEPQRIISELSGEVMAHLNCQVFFNYLTADDTGRLQLNAFGGIDAGAAKKIEFLEPGQAVCGLAAKHRRCVTVERIQEAKDPASAVVRSFGVRAYCAHPLTGPNGSVLGTLSFGTTARETFQSDEVALMKAVADHVATAIARQRVTEALRASEERFRELADAMPQLVWTSNPDGTVDYYNRRREAYTGIVPGGHGGYVWAPTLHPDDVQATLEAWQRAVETGGTYDIEHRVRLADGRYRWHLSRALAVLDADGHVAKWYGTATDIDDTKRAEEALRESEERFRTLYATMTQGVGMLDLEGRVRDANAAAARILGTTAEEIIGLDHRLFMARSVRETGTEFSHDELPFEVALRSRRPVIDTLMGVYVRGSEEPRWLLLSMLPQFRPGTDEMVGMFATFQDITERKQLEEQIRRHNEELEQVVADRTRQIRLLERQRLEAEKQVALGHMAARIAHEINNPLGAVKNAFQILKPLIPPTSPDYRWVGLMDSEITRIARIVRQTSGLYKKEQHEVIRISPLDVVSDVVQLMQGSMQARGVTVVVHPPESPFHAVVHTDSLKQLLYGILQNAVEASASRSTVQVNFTHDDKTFTLAIADQGCGIPPDIGGKIFEPFFTTKDQLETGGLGLGLSIARSLVDAMGGAIGYQSTVGKGTTFFITLPLAAPETAPAPAAETLKANS